MNADLTFDAPLGLGFDSSPGNPGTDASDSPSHVDAARIDDGVDPHALGRDELDRRLEEGRQRERSGSFARPKLDESPEELSSFGASWTNGLWTERVWPTADHALGDADDRIVDACATCRRIEPLALLEGALLCANCSNNKPAGGGR
jgi:hypothetical protein